MKKTITLGLAAITIICMSFDVMDNNGIAGVTGSPSEKTCNQTGCHNSFSVNTGGNYRS